MALLGFFHPNPHQSVDDLQTSEDLVLSGRFFGRCRALSKISWTSGWWVGDQDLSKFIAWHFSIRLSKLQGTPPIHVDKYMAKLVPCFTQVPRRRRPNLNRKSHLTLNGKCCCPILIWSAKAHRSCNIGSVGTLDPFDTNLKI